MEKSGTHISSQKPWGYNNKIQFSSLLKEAWEKAMIPTNICSGFINAGIYPLKGWGIWWIITNQRAGA